MLADRLIFGCGHLTGGASLGEARRIVERARAAGIRHFDTAPSYGIGTAEDAIGRILGNGPEVAITAKVGSVRPAHAALKTYARRAVRAVRGARAAGSFDPSTQPELGCFEPEFMARSFAESLRALRRDHVDVLLLHEAYRDDIRSEVARFLQQALDDGRAGAIGYSNSMPYDAALHADWRGWVAQTAVPVGLLTGAEAAPASPVIFHSLIKVGDWLARSDPRYAAGREAFTNVVRSPAARWLLPYCLAAARAPEARLIYTSSRLDRLDAFLGAMTAADDLAEGVAAFDRAYSAAATS